MKMRRPPGKEMARPWRSEEGSCILQKFIVRCWAVAWCVPVEVVSIHSVIDVVSTSSPPIPPENAGYFYIFSSPLSMHRPPRYFFEFKFFFIMGSKTSEISRLKY